MKWIPIYCRCPQARRLAAVSVVGTELTFQINHPPRPSSGHGAKYLVQTMTVDIAGGELLRLLPPCERCDSHDVVWCRRLADRLARLKGKKSLSLDDPYPWHTSIDPDEVAARSEGEETERRRQVAEAKAWKKLAQTRTSTGSPSPPLKASVEHPTPADV
jgi:hypothetical protein